MIEAVILLGQNPAPEMNVPSLKTNSSPLKMGRAPKGKACLPTTNFQVLLPLVSGSVYPLNPGMFPFDSKIFESGHGVVVPRMTCRPLWIPVSNWRTGDRTNQLLMQAVNDSFPLENSMKCRVNHILSVHPWEKLIHKFGLII